MLTEADIVTEETPVYAEGMLGSLEIEPWLLLMVTFAPVVRPDVEYIMVQLLDFAQGAVGEISIETEPSAFLVTVNESPLPELTGLEQTDFFLCFERWQSIGLPLLLPFPPFDFPLFFFLQVKNQCKSTIE